MVQIVFSDFDGTLLHYHREKNYFSKYELNILKKLRQCGIKFCIVTGRSIQFFKQFPELLEYVDYILASNGAVIYEVESEKVIYFKLIQENSLKQIVRYALSKKFSFVLNCLEECYRYDCDSLPSYDDFCFGHYSCEQVVLLCDNKKLKDCMNYLSTFSDIIVNNFNERTNECVMDINCSGVSKGNSIVWLCQYLGIEKKDTVAFGDGENDLSMFEAVGKSVAVANASDKIRQISSDISLKCEDSGVFHYLEDNILK